mmetsp:Transcript_54687/g.119870  ORF Transcript_54687/g.119870 Transcript_54687/m.119870 type:complete len:351 (-) Transcript_54687:53-1105(-)
MAGDPELSADAAFCAISQDLEEERLGCLGCACRRAELLLALFCLVPIRFVLVLLTAVLMWLVCRIVIALGLEPCMGAWDALKVHSSAQRAMLRLNALLARAMLLWMGFWWIHVRRFEGSQKGGKGPTAPTIVANHVTALDGMFVAVATGGQITGVGVRWLVHVPFASTIARAIHMLVVGGAAASKPSRVSPPSDDAGQPVPKLSSTDIIVEYQRRRAADPRILQLLIFPEGFTKAERCLLRFRSGAFVAGEPVQPVVLRFPHRRRGANISWVGSAGCHLFLMMSQWYNRAEVVFLPIYTPDASERANPQLYADNVQRAMADAMGLPEERVSSTVGAQELSRWLAEREKLG